MCVCVCQELLAAEWVGMLQHGALDADTFPEKASLIIDMLWSVTSNASARVSSLQLLCHSLVVCAAHLFVGIFTEQASTVSTMLGL